jgi:hypothetical protein
MRRAPDCEFANGISVLLIPLAPPALHAVAVSHFFFLVLGTLVEN